MIKNLLGLVLVLLLNTPFLLAQHHENCGFDHKHNQLLLNKAYRDFINKTESEIQKFKPSQSKSSTEIYTIPVVVHVLHLGEAIGVGTNISDAQINSAITHLNQVYRGQTANSPVDFGIEFILAQQDPNCNATTGINRVDASGVPNYSAGGVDYYGDGGEADEDILKDLSRWPETEYFNIWIISEIENNNGLWGIQGYANFFSGSAYEGSMMMANVFGHDPNNNNPSFNLKAPRDNGTVVHEFGHYLHLHHTFKGDDDADQNGIGDNCPLDQTVGVDSDGCADTEVHKRHTSQCKTGQINDCTGAIFDNNVALNYMSYASCQDRLTDDQKTRSRAMLSSSGLSLVYSIGDKQPIAGAGNVIPSNCSPQTQATGLSGGYAGIMGMTIPNTYSSSSSNAQNDGGYIDYSGQCLKTIMLYEDSTYDFNFTTWVNDHNLKAYIDFNNDGDFNDLGEEFLNLNTTDNGSYPYTDGSTTATVPSVNGTTILGGTPLRLRLNADIGNVANACEDPLYGQVEDYALVINQINAIPPVTNNISADFCAGTNYFFNGANLSNPGTYRDTIAAGAASGGDSIIVLTLSTYPEMNLSASNTPTTCFNGADGTIDLTVSNGSGPYNYDWDIDGVGVYDDPQDLNSLSAGTYCVSVSDQNNCLKNECYTITSPADIINNVNETVCFGADYTYHGTLYNSGNTNGVHVLTNNNGCDSTVNFSLTVDAEITGSENVNTCQNYDWNGITYNTTGTYVQTLVASNGCDSTATLNLNISPEINNSENITACNSYNFNGTILNTSGTYKDTLITNNGCDSIITLNLTINNVINHTDNISSCEDYLWNGITYTNSGTYKDTLQTSNGCDSIITLNLTINNSGASFENITTCDSYQWNGTLYSNSGTYYDTLQTTNGCDSVLTLNLIINNTSNTTEIISSCGSYIWHNTNYNTTGSYQDTLQSINGCDSITTLNLTILTVLNSSESATSCDNYTWHNSTYNTSGSYYDTLQSLNGCDSVVTLNLTIHPSFDFADTISSCDQYQWNNNNYSTSGFYIDSLSSSNGCDSISSLLLTINYSFADTLSAAACNNYTWEGSSYSSSGFYQANYTNSNGCDSTLYLSLVINSSYSDTTTQAHCDNYTWNNQLYSTSGIYVDSNLNSSGCDSLNYLNLSIYPTYVDTFFKAVCDTFVWNNNTYTSSGIYTDTLTSINACDSVVSYELNVNNQMGSPITLQLVLDDYCKETRWTIKDSQDSLWYEGGPYDCIPNGGGNQANDTIIQDIYIDANECYTFDLIDDFGDGMSASTYGGTDGEWLLTDYNGITLMQGQGNFGSVISADVHIITAIPSSISMNNTHSNAIQVFPNPFSDESQIVINDPQHKIDYQIVDAQGRVVRNATSSQNTFIINKGNLSNGLYWLKILNLPNLKPVLLVIE